MYKHLVNCTIYLMKKSKLSKRFSWKHKIWKILLKKLESDKNILIEMSFKNSHSRVKKIDPFW